MKSIAAVSYLTGLRRYGARGADNDLPEPI
jgi:hypothetical protein